MGFPETKTKIVCTVGPACSDGAVLREMMAAGMSVARINFAHGGPDEHRRLVRTVREAARATGSCVAVLADLGGPKIRVGRLPEEPLTLERDRLVTLEPGAEARGEGAIPLDAPGIGERLSEGDSVYVNDGLVHLLVERSEPGRVVCRVVQGGPILGGNGVNLPGVDLGVPTITEEDRACLRLAAEEGIDAVSVSFVRGPDDMELAREIATGYGYSPFLVAKIERRAALRSIEAILEVTDGLMVARGDLGVEIPIEEIAVVQKRLVSLANRAGVPVITATQMLESMVGSRRPTRAEATDVANAIMDGTDCVMLSEETAIGGHPVEAVSTMRRIAVSAEESLESSDRPPPELHYRGAPTRSDLVAMSVAGVVSLRRPEAVVTPTSGGTTPARISSYRLPVWTLAMSTSGGTCRRLQLCRGVHPVQVEDPGGDWREAASGWLREAGCGEGIFVLATGSSPANADAVDGMQIVDL